MAKEVFQNLKGNVRNKPNIEPVIVEIKDKKDRQLKYKFIGTDIDKKLMFCVVNSFKSDTYMTSKLNVIDNKIIELGRGFSAPIYITKKEFNKLKTKLNLDQYGK